LPSPPYVAEPAEPPPPVSVAVADDNDDERLLASEETRLDALLNASDLDEVTLSWLLEALLRALLASDAADVTADEALSRADDAADPDAVEARPSALERMFVACERMEDKTEGWEGRISEAMPAIEERMSWRASLRCSCSRALAAARVETKRVVALVKCILYEFYVVRYMVVDVNEGLKRWSVFRSRENNEM
jgi:hypothetical protein